MWSKGKFGWASLLVMGMASVGCQSSSDPWHPSAYPNHSGRVAIGQPSGNPANRMPSTALRPPYVHGPAGTPSTGQVAGGPRVPSPPAQSVASHDSGIQLVGGTSDAPPLVLDGSVPSQNVPTVDIYIPAMKVKVPIHQLPPTTAGDSSQGDGQGGVRTSGYFNPEVAPAAAGKRSGGGSTTPVTHLPSPGNTAVRGSGTAAPTPPIPSEATRVRASDGGTAPTSQPPPSPPPVYGGEKGAGARPNPTGADALTPIIADDAMPITPETGRHTNRTGELAGAVPILCLRLPDGSLVPAPADHPTQAKIAENPIDRNKSSR